LWHTNDFDRPKTLTGHEGPVRAIAYNHRGTLLATSGDDETVRLWVPATERQVQRGTSGQSPQGLRFSEDDRFLVATARGQTNVLAWEALGEEYVVLQVRTDRTDPLRAIDFSPDGRWLLAATGRAATLWKADSGRELGSIPVTNAHAVRFAADSRRVLASSDDGLLESALDFHENSGSFRVEIGPVRRMETVPPLDWLGTMDLDQARTTAAVIRRDRVLLVPLPSSPGGSLRTIRLGTHYHKVAFHPAGAWLAASWAGTNELHLWNLAEASEAATPTIIPFAEHFAFSADGRWLAACSGGQFQFYRVGAWTQQEFSIPRKLASDQHAPVAFSGDGRVVAVASSRYVVQLFRMPTTDRGQPELIATLEGPDRLPLEMLTFSPDGRRLAAATDRQIVQLWNLQLLRDGLAESNLHQNWLEYP
jgi:WD40 repeat protein